MKLKLQDLELNGKTVLMRVDFNVPIKGGVITDDTRIKAALPSIQYILDHGASLVLMSHLGRPKGPDPALSLAPCAQRLSELLHTSVPLCNEPIPNQKIVLLENLRFHRGEEHPEEDPDFAKHLASFGDIYVNDAFGTAHRAHSSTAIIAKYFPRCSAMGFLMEKEIAQLAPLLAEPKRPFFAIIGGAKVSSKIGVIKKLLERVDTLFIGGAMAFTFFKAEGREVGDSLVEDPALIQDLQGEKLRLPVDMVATDGKHIQVVKEIPKGWKGMDIGPETIVEWSKELQKGATLFWNGPLGVFEIPQFAKGTRAIAEALPPQTIIGGGETLAAIKQLNKKFSHLSTGGGASLEFLEFGHLPGIDALTNVN